MSGQEHLRASVQNLSDEVAKAVAWMKDKAANDSDSEADAMVRCLDAAAKALDEAMAAPEPAPPPASDAGEPGATDGA